MARYLDSVKLFKKPSTYKHYRNALGRFKERCTRLFVHQVSRDDLVDFMGYLAGLGLDHRTIYTKTMVVVQMLKDAGCSGLLRKGDWPRYTTEERPIYTPKNFGPSLGPRTRMSGFYSSSFSSPASASPRSSTLLGRHRLSRTSRAREGQSAVGFYPQELGREGSTDPTYATGRPLGPEAEGTRELSLSSHRREESPSTTCWKSAKQSGRGLA